MTVGGHLLHHFNVFLVASSYLKAAAAGLPRQSGGRTNRKVTVAALADTSSAAHT